MGIENEVGEMQGFNVLSNIDLPISDKNNTEILNFLKVAFLDPAIKQLIDSIAKEIYRGYSNGEFEGMQTFLFTLRTQVKKHDGSLEGFYSYEVHK